MNKFEPYFVSQLHPAIAAGIYSRRMLFHRRRHAWHRAFGKDKKAKRELELSRYVVAAWHSAVTSLATTRDDRWPGIAAAGESSWLGDLQNRLEQECEPIDDKTRPKLARAMGVLSESINGTFYEDMDRAKGYADSLASPSDVGLFTFGVLLCDRFCRPHEPLALTHFLGEPTDRWNEKAKRHAEWTATTHALISRISPESKNAVRESLDKCIEQFNSRRLVSLRENFPPLASHELAIQKNESGFPVTDPSNLAEVQMNPDIIRANETKAEKLTNPPQFVFRLNGDIYTIKAFGEEGQFASTGGMDVIRSLLQSPAKPVNMKVLIYGCAADALSDVTLSRQDAIDEETNQQVSERIGTLTAECKELERKGDFDNLKAIRKELAENERYLASSTGAFDRPRNLNSELNRLRPRVFSLLKTVWKNLRAANSPLNITANHLETSISSEGEAFVYRPSKPIDWETF